MCRSVEALREGSSRDPKLIVNDKRHGSICIPFPCIAVQRHMVPAFETISNIPRLPDHTQSLRNREHIIQLQTSNTS